MSAPVFIVSGISGSGKTTVLKKLAHLLKNENIHVGGLLAEGTWENDKRDSFNLIDLSRNEHILYCQREQKYGWEAIGPFYINPLGQKFGETALSIDFLQNCQLIIIDEIGPFELQGKGWAKPFEMILKKLDIPIVISIRSNLVEKVVQYWNLKVFVQVEVAASAHHRLFEQIKNWIP